MRILSLTPGTGGTFYCQNCLRDGQMVRALRKQGHDIVVVPLYLPILLDSEGLNTGTVFFGGVNVFLQQKAGFFRNTPRWLDKIFDSAWMLRKAASREGSTRAADLGPMTHSMLQGKDGLQRKELERLVEWLKGEPRPDIVHLSNALLLGVAGEIKAALGVPIVCSLQDEDTFLDAMNSPWRERCWNLIAERAKDVDAFVAVSDWYAEKIAGKVSIPREKIRTVHLGIEWDDVEPAALDFDPPVLGYLSRINHSQGFTALVDAFLELKRDERFRNLRLRATGGVTSGDQAYIKQVLAKIAAAGYSKDVEIVEEFGKVARQYFLRSVSVLSAPAADGEAFGLFIVEANACGVPVVQPDAGAFREVLESTGGGVVYDQKKPGALVEALRTLLLDPARARELGLAGRKVVMERFTSRAMAEKMEAVFRDFAPEADVA